MTETINENMDFQQLVAYVKTLASKIEKLEKENEKLKGCVLKKKKLDIIDYLNEETNKPPICFKQWIESLDYKYSIKTVFREDLLTGMIEVLDRGVNNISIVDHAQLPLRIFSNKPNSIYIYDIDSNSDEKLAKWILLLNTDLDKWFSYMSKRFLIEFKDWFDINKELVETDEKMKDHYVNFLQKTLGAQRISEESRNQRLKQYIYKAIKEPSIKN